MDNYMLILFLICSMFVLIDKNNVLSQPEPILTKNEKKDRRDKSVRGKYKLNIDNKIIKFHTDSLELVAESNLLFIYRYKQDYIGIIKYSKNLVFLEKEKLEESYKYEKKGFITVFSKEIEQEILEGN